jgi:pre-mRNA-splicing factor ATP-dependent RNA helicase DHX38/PRP16
LLRSEGITASQEPRKDIIQGLGDFQRRSNRDRDQRWNGRRRDDRSHDRDRRWEATPRSDRDDAPSMRVPNVGWDSTPRNGRAGDGGWGNARDRAWDAPTPRGSRGSPDEDDRPIHLDTHEWEEEQLRLDRDWYSSAEEGGLLGDEMHNPLAQYEDLTAIKQAEIATKQVVCKILILTFVNFVS